MGARAKVWIFPLLLVAAAVVLSGLRLSGTSVGVYNRILNGDRAHDPDLVVNQPQLIRADEWRVNTPLVVSQWRLDYPRVNHTVGEGQDMSVVVDVPYKEWSTFFRPQNWAFFVLPLEHAFAFKWWFLAGLLAVSAYVFVLKVIPGRILLAALVALGVVASPFVQWWYQTITVAPIAYALLILVVLLQLEDAGRPRTRWLLGAALAYLLVAFALLLYPPFQIPCATAAAFFYAGHLVAQRHRLRELLRTVVPVVVAAGAAAGAVVVAFAATRWSVISDVRHTVYPGNRLIDSGGYSVFHFLAGPLLGQLQYTRTAAGYFTNQSEAATFIFVWPYLVVPSLYLAVRHRRRMPVVAFSSIAVTVLLGLYSVRLFLPLPDVLAKAMLVSTILPARLLMGFGVLGILQVVCLLRLRREATIPLWMLAVTVAFALVAQLAVGFVLRHRHPAFISSSFKIVVLAALVAAAVGLLLTSRPAAGAALLLAVSAFAVFRIHPLYRGLDPLEDSRLVDEIARQAKASPGHWVFISEVNLVNIVPAAGAPAFTAVYAYPQFEVWEPLDPDGQLRFIYNRYAAVEFTPQDLGMPFALAGPDAFRVHYDACASPFAERVRHVVSLRPLTAGCLVLDAQVRYPRHTFYLYSVRTGA